jgi:hypothetical protein
MESLDQSQRLNIAMLDLLPVVDRRVEDGRTELITH